MKSPKDVSTSVKVRPCDSEPSPPGNRCRPAASDPRAGGYGPGRLDGRLDWRGLQKVEFGRRGRPHRIIDERRRYLRRHQRHSNHRMAHLADGVRERVIARPVRADIPMAAVELRRDGFRGHDSSGSNTRPTGLQLRLPGAGVAGQRPIGDDRFPLRECVGGDETRRCGGDAERLCEGVMLSKAS